MVGRRLAWLFCVSLAVAIGGKATCAQSVTIFGNALPKNPIDDGLAVTLGVKFWSSAPGTISGIRFYRAVRSPQGYVAKLCSAGGTLLGSATIAQETGPVPGWQQAQFASPVSIAANTTYIAAYYSPVGQGAWDPNALSRRCDEWRLDRAGQFGGWRQWCIWLWECLPEQRLSKQQLLR
jgi:hypothetical protein